MHGVPAGAEWSITASAPGKLILIGEYAVLHGAPALVMAVDRRADVRIEPTLEALCEIHTPGLAEGSVQLRFEHDGSIQWVHAEAASEGRYRLVEQVAQSLIADQLVERWPPFRASLDTTAFFATGPAGERIKLGLGSSAALTVAFASALLRFAAISAHRSPPQSSLDDLLRAHRRFQRGMGSGVDVAASYHGGLICYRRGKEAISPVVERIDWPDDLNVLAVWTGRATSTRGFLDRVAGFAAAQPGAFNASMGRLRETAERARRSLATRRIGEFLEAIAEYGSGLRALGEAANIPVFGEEHSKIQGLAHQAGAVYKPSGAGGGDIGVAFAADGRKLQRLAAALADSAFQPMTLQHDPIGLQTATTRE